MNCTFKILNESQVTGNNAQLIPLFFSEENNLELKDVACGLSSTDKDLIKHVVENHEFNPAKNEYMVVHGKNNDEIKQIVLLGMGIKAHCDLDKLRTIFGNAIRFLRSKNILEVDVHLSILKEFRNGIETQIQAITEGLALGNYEFYKWKSKDKTNETIHINFVIKQMHANEVEQCQKGMLLGAHMSEGVELARDMVNNPANKMTPTDMANIAINMEKMLPVSSTVLEYDDMVSLGMEALIGVAKGSVELPKLIIVKYEGDPNNPDNNICFIGKGITFDTGGISLKPPAGMENMKGDMAGGASVLGAMHIVASCKPTVNVIGIIPATENMPGGSAQKPGDVVTTMNGKTIEVINTDAEGRLVLADALCYADFLGVKKVIDVATLTGAMVVTFGKVCTGFMSNDQEFSNALLAASRSSGEKFWELPLFDEYEDLIKSDVADMKNTGGRQAGSITAAMLLKNFVNGMSWIHLDIAGTSTSTKNNGYLVKGATGLPARTLAQIAIDMSEKSD